MKTSLRLLAAALIFGGLVTACGDDDLSKSKADYNPRYEGDISAEQADYTVTSDASKVSISFKSDMDWTATVLDANGDVCKWAKVTPESGTVTTPGYPGTEGKEAQEFTVEVSIDAYESTDVDRVATLVVSTDKAGSNNGIARFTIGQAYKVLYLEPSQISDYAKYICPSAGNEHFQKGPDYMLRHDAYYSWHRMKQSEHFFVFWSPEFGADPNSEDVPAAMRVDIDDLLAKAEQFFDTNVNKLKMATLGQGKSMLDDYKMQIYLIYQDEWLATGAGYDNNIGALWVNPSTCQPVGSTIAHEIGHSFQYQTYADRVRRQGAPDDLSSGFRYGFVGPDGSGNGGCAYWEQCAQWQAQRDYPREQFESYNYQVWLSNCHRHFHHEWQRYASYWLPSYFVQKHGIEAYGRIWTESLAPEDAIAAYTRLYNGGDYATTREELFDYAVRMATYDIDGVREYSDGYQDRYRTTFLRTAGDAYQIAYSSCPGATGFNVISLNVPENGGEVSVDFEGLAYGAALHPKDKGQMVDGDGKVVGTTTVYNTVGGVENMGWRYGFVALSGNTRTYGDVAKDAKGTLKFNVPAGTEHLFLVVQGSPETYMSHGWDEVESNDAQFPYQIKLNGTDLRYYEEIPEPIYSVVDDNTLEGTLSLSVSTQNGDWLYTTISIASEEVLSFFGMSADEFSAALVTPAVGVAQELTDGKIVVFNRESDGSLNNLPTANFGYWVNADGNAVSWGNGQVIYYELDGVNLSLGKLGNCADYAGQALTMRPVFVYKNGDVEKTLDMSVTYRFK